MKTNTKVAFLGWLLVSFALTMEAAEIADNVIVTDHESLQNVAKYLISSIAAIIATGIVSFAKRCADNIFKNKKK